MNKKTELASQLMDNEAIDITMVDALVAEQKRSANNATADDSWYSFHLIRDVLQGKTPEFVVPELHVKIAEAIAEEPTLMVPEAHREINGWRRKISEWAEQLTSYAIAASVCTFILYSVQQIQTPDIEAPSAITTLELIEPTDYQIANQTSPLQDELLDISRMSTIYGGQHMGKYVQGVNYSVAIPLKPITEKRVFELNSLEDKQKAEEQQSTPPRQ